MIIYPKKALGITYCLFTLFLLAFVNYNGATEFFDMTVPYVEGHVIVIHFIMAVIFAALLIVACVYDRSLKVDQVAAGLIIKLLIDAIPFFRDSVEFFDYFWHWSCTAVALITYLLFLNADLDQKNEKKIKQFLVIFGVTLSAQVIYTFLNCGYDYLNLKYKIAMVIPYGGSNIIASALLPLFFLIYYSAENKVVKTGLLTLVIIGIALTKSRGAMLYGAAVLFLCLYQKNKTTSRAFVKNMLLILAVVFLAGALLSDESFLTLMQGFQTGNSRTLSGFTSGRTALWGDMLAAMLDSNLLFGVGMKSLAGHTAGAHNVIIDAFYKGGVIGGINYLIVLVVIIRTAVQNLKNSDKSWGVMTLILIGNMMFEVNYFSYNCDVFFWIIAGMMMASNYRNRDANCASERMN